MGAASPHPRDDHVDGPAPGADHEQGQPNVERRVRLHRRVERVQHARLEREHGGEGHQGPNDCDRVGHAGQCSGRQASDLGIDHDVAKRHDEKRREHERHQDPVRRDRHVIHARRPVRHVEAGATQCLHHCHARRHAEGNNCHPEIRQDQITVREQPRAARGRRSVRRGASRASGTHYGLQLRRPRLRDTRPWARATEMAVRR